MVVLFKIPYGPSFLYRNYVGDVFYAKGELTTFLYTHLIKNLDHIELTQTNGITSQDIDWYNKNINNLEAINKDTHPSFKD